MAEHTIAVDVYDDLIPLSKHDTIPVINENNPVYNYLINANQCYQMLPLSRYYVFVRGTNPRIRITYDNYYKYFPEGPSGGGGGGIPSGAMTVKVFQDRLVFEELE